MRNLHIKSEGSYFENSDVFARKGETICVWGEWREGVVHGNKAVVQWEQELYKGT